VSEKTVFNRFFKIYILLEVLLDAIIPIFLICAVYMFLDDNNVFDSPIYDAVAALICTAVLFWIYKVIQSFFKAGAAEDE